MENDLLEELLVTLNKYHKQQEFYENENGTCSDESEIFMEYQLLGVTKFVQTIAQKLKFTDLENIADKIKVDVLEDIKEEYKAIEEHHEALAKEQEFQMEVRKFCIQLFYIDTCYKVDMSKYIDIIESNNELFDRAGLLKRLRNYTDEAKVLDKIYTQVKRAVKYNYDQGIPSKEEIDHLFELELQNIYRKADSYILSQLAVAKQ